MKIVAVRVPEEIKTMHTIYKEHLYELQGFRDLLGSKLVDRLKQKAPLCDIEIPRLPRGTGAKSIREDRDRG